MPQATGPEDTYALLAAGVTGAATGRRPASARYGERPAGRRARESRVMDGRDFYASQVTFAEAVAEHITREDTVVVAAPYDLSFIGHVAERALETIGATLLSAGSSDTVCPASRTLAIMRGYGATALVGTPRVALELARLDRSLYDAPHTLDTLVLIGGTASPRGCERIADLWGAAAVRIFGTALLPTIGIGCPKGEIHVCGARSDVGVGHPSAARIAPGGLRGELWLSVRDGRRDGAVPTPTGELVELRPAAPPCGCGGTGPVVIPLGPVSETLPTEHGLLSPVDVERVAHGAADLAPDLHCGTDGTRFRLTCTPGPGEPCGGDELARRLEACLRDELGTDVHVAVGPPDATPQHAPAGGTGGPGQTRQPTEEVAE